MATILLNLPIMQLLFEGGIYFEKHGMLTLTHKNSAKHMSDTELTLARGNHLHVTVYYGVQSSAIIFNTIDLEIFVVKIFSWFA